MNNYDVPSEIDRITIHGHVAFFVGITVVSCCLLLMYHAPAAIGISLMVMLPFVAYLVHTGNRIEQAIALNLLLVAFAMFYVLLSGYRGFQDRIASEVATKQLSYENERIAYTDSLTNLPNRRAFFDELTAMLASPAEKGKVHAVGVMDIDGFKQANDIYGHAMGDKVLVECAKRIRFVGSPKLFVSRLGGDEFGLILRDQTSQTDIVMIGDELCDALTLPFSDGDAQVMIGASVGFCIVTDYSQKAQDIYEAADYALYHSKTKNRGSTTLFTAEHEIAIKNKAIFEQELRHCDFEKELSLHFQPIVSAHSGQIKSFEALARWNNAMLGSVSPAEFIPAAERLHLIHRVTRVLLAKALEALKHWPDHIEVSFNLSMRDVSSTWQIDQLVTMVEDSGIDARRLSFEVTEGAMVDDFEKARAALITFKKMGCSISLDDFGTGYSSLAYIHRLPLDKIKIDRSFVKDIQNSEASRNIVRSIVGLCQMLGLKSVVEGMENKQQVDSLCVLGCDLMQGYYFAKPMSFEEACQAAQRGVMTVAS